MNNKGQTLVLFVVLLPIILLIFVAVIDLGNIYIEKRKINNVIDTALQYRESGKNIRDFINKNIEDLDEVIINDDYIIIKKTKKGILKDYYLEISKEGWIYVFK